MSCFGGGTLAKIGDGLSLTSLTVGVGGLVGVFIGIGEGDKSARCTFDVLSGSIPESPDP